MRFLQIHNFYEPYIRQFYGSRPTLSSKSFEEQISALIDDAFSGCHLFAPHLDPAKYQGSLIIDNCQQTQAQWAKEHGLQLSFFPGWEKQMIRIQIETLRPEILYISHPIEYDSGFLRSLNWKPELIMGWRAAAVPTGTDFSSYELMLTSATASKARLLEAGAKDVEFFSPAIPRAVWERVAQEKKEVDVVFCGQWGAEHKRRNEMLTQVGKAPLGWRGDFSIDYYLLVNPVEPITIAGSMYNKGPVYGLDMYRALRRGKIGLNGIIDFAAGEAGNMRMFEVTAVRTLLLTENHESLKKYFEPGKEIETYCSTAELLDKIYYYLEHENEREEIAKRGWERCMKEHSMEVRIPQFQEIIENRLRKKSSKPSNLVIEGAVGSLEEQETLVLKHIDAAIEAAGTDPAGALTHIEEANSFQIPVRDLHHFKGLCLLKLGRKDEAITSLEDELRFFPDNMNAEEVLRQLTGIGQS